MTDTVITAMQAQMDTPKSSVKIDELPCGYLDKEGNLHTEIVVREITGEEEDLLAARNVKISKKMNELLSRCVQRVGSITDPRQIREAILDLPLGDRVFLMFAIRRATLGDEYPFKAKCTGCNKESTYVVDLNELEVRKMVDPKQRVFDATLPSGRTARFRVATGRDEEKLTAAMDSLDSLSLALLIRLELLDGKPPTMGDVKAMGLRDRSFLRDQFNDNEGGVDTEVTMTCPMCGAEFSLDIDIGQAGFFFPSGTRKSSKRR